MDEIDKKWLLLGMFGWGGLMWGINVIPEGINSLNKGYPLKIWIIIVKLFLWLFLGSIFGLLMSRFSKKNHK